jgi:hypothetical protein
VTPKIFSIGDIVEARIAFAAVPVSSSEGKEYKFVLLLRSLALIENAFTKVFTG